MIDNLILLFHTALVLVTHTATADLSSKQAIAGSNPLSRSNRTRSVNSRAKNVS
jgi:hypothetical protein